MDECLNTQKLDLVSGHVIMSLKSFPQVHEVIKQTKGLKRTKTFPENITTKVPVF